MGRPTLTCTVRMKNLGRWVVCESLMHNTASLSNSWGFAISGGCHFFQEWIDPEIEIFVHFNNLFLWPSVLQINAHSPKLFKNGWAGLNWEKRPNSSLICQVLLHLKQHHPKWEEVKRPSLGGFVSFIFFESRTCSFFFKFEKLVLLIKKKSSLED